MDKVIEDMAEAIAGGDWDDLVDWNKLKFLNEAKAALATLPEFIVLDEGAEPEYGDLAIDESDNIAEYMHGGGVINWQPRDDFHGFDNDSANIFRRNDIPVLTRKKEQDNG